MRELDVVSPETWLARLEERLQSKSDDFKSNPALRLIDFYCNGLRAGGQAMKPMSVSIAMVSSSTLKN
jgi:hypothetical protein